MQKQKLLSDEQIARLKKFNRNVAELMQTQFVKDMTTENISIHFAPAYVLGSKKPTLSPNRKGHKIYDFRAISTHIRLFMKNGTDNISLGQIADLYDSLQIDQEYKERIANIRTQVNNHLKDNIWAFFLQPAPTYQTVVEAFVYGLFLHMDDDKLKLIEEWEKDPRKWEEACFNFEHFLRGLVVCMRKIQLNNEEILDKYG